MHLRSTPPRSDATFSETVTRLGALITIIMVALIFPLGYAALAYQHLAGLLQTRAALVAVDLSQLVTAHPTTWRFQQHRTEELLWRGASLDSPELRRIVDEKHAEVVASRTTVAWPLMVQRADVLDAGVPVGWVEVGRSLRPLLGWTVVAALAGLGVGACVFITVRVLPLRALKGSQERFRSVARSALDAIILADSEGRVLSWNEGAHRIFGRAENDMIGHPLTTIMAEPSAPSLSRLLRERAGTSRAPVAPVELLGVRADGGQCPIDLSLSAWTEGGGHVFYGAIIRDITDRKRVEATQAAAHAEAVRVSRLKSEFLATMSHEIRTPMNGVIGMTALLLDTALTPEQQEYAQTVRRSGEALLAIINDILDFSKIEAGRLELEPVPFALRETLAETLKTLAPLAHTKGLELAYEISPEVPDGLMADAGRVGQVLLNLTGNAIKFTEHGEVAVHVDAEAVTPHEVTLRVAVRDTGIGIAADKRSLIFEAFAQEDASTTRRFGGTGLGLAISRRLVELMGGRIWVDSEVGRGSTFHFTAQLRRAQQPVPKHVPAPGHALAGLPILVVDDNATNRRLLQAMLTAWGAAPTLVAGGQAALVALEHARGAGRPFSLVLLDAHMPDMDGFAVAERIRQEPGLGDVTIMLLTSDSNDLARCRKLGIARHLVKPLTPSEVLNAVLLVLGESVETTVGPSAPAGPGVEASSSRLHVLVAEDNPVNQRLIVRLLEKLGHAVVVAANGQEAVEMYEARPFDLVLMDVQMPVMDGLSATAAIRHREAQQPSRRRLPIVGLTAYAMRGDRERCLAAGMDDYLTKPIKLEELNVALSRLGGDPRSAAGADARPEAEPATEGGFDLTAALTYVGGDRELLDELLTIFVEDAPARMHAVRQAIAGGDAAEMMRETHALKGALQALGVTTAAALAQRLETLGRAGSVSGASEIAAMLDGKVDQLLQAHRNAPHLAAFQGERKDLVAGPAEVEIYRTLTD